MVNIKHDQKTYDLNIRSKSPLLMIIWDFAYYAIYIFNKKKCKIVN